MNNPDIFKALAILAFIVSAMFTIQLFASSSYGIAGYCLMVAVAVIYECGKCSLLFQAISGNFGSTGKAIMFGMWVFLTVASVFVSAGYVLNQSNATKNETILNSAAYRQQQDKQACSWSRWWLWSGRGSKPSMRR